MVYKDNIKAKAVGLYNHTHILSKQIWSTHKKYVIIGAIAVVSVIGYSLSASGNSDTAQSVITHNVRTGSIQETINIIGHAELTEEQKIRFNQLGKVSGVHVKVGDTVQRGDLIATLDQTTAFNNIKQAQLDLQNANLKLQQIKEGDEKYTHQP